MNKNIFFICFAVFVNIPLFSQNMGSNMDASQQDLGARPYEMKPDLRKANIDFVDCEQWIVQPSGCSANLYRSQEQLVTSNYSGKLVYKAQQKGSISIFLKLKNPFQIHSNWDSMDMWVYGDDWSWMPTGNLSMNLYAVFEDANGNRENIYLSKLYYKYWFLNHTKLNSKRDIYFVGLLLKNDIADVGILHTVYLSNIYFYKENISALTFNSFPNKLPFPIHKTTILPSIKTSNYRNHIISEASSYEFKYEGKNHSISYKLANNDVFGYLSVYLNNKFIYSLSDRKIVLENDTKADFLINSRTISSDTLFYNCTVRYKDKNVPFIVWYTIRQKSLIVGIKELEDKGIVKEMYSGTISYNEGKHLKIPFLKYNYGYNNRPCVLYTKGLFTFMMFDWYTTNASQWVCGNQSDGIFTGDKVAYLMKTNGEKNPLNEKLFINVSSDVQEIFPTIDNPISTVKNLFSDRLYSVAQGANLESLKKTYSSYRKMGIDRIFLRSHEEFWRKGGESFTFKLTPNPDLGEQGVKNFISFIHGLGWKFSLYTNYCDFASVSSRWNPDWVIRLSDGNWQKAWTRCYAAKPQIAYEQEAILAPQIHENFNTDFSYCDVQTAVSPMDRVDYDYRVPQSGMMRATYNCYGMLLQNERRSYGGPVFSEGGSHWWYAGLVDGNYANDDLINLPVFPDFALLKINPLEMDFARNGSGYQYISYALAYGNAGIVESGVDATKRYMMLQPIQSDYISSSVRKIQYCTDGKEYDSSDAIKNDMLQSPKLHIIYNSGLEMYINFSEVNWKVVIGNNQYMLPQYGFIVYDTLKGLKSISAISSQSHDRCDKVYSSNLYYLDTHDKTINEELGGHGSYVIKKDNGNWEIIPLIGNSHFDFSLSLLGLSGHKITLECLNSNGSFIDKKIGIFKTRVSFTSQPSVFKYRVVVLKK